MKHQCLIKLLALLGVVSATSARADFSITFDSGPLSSEWSGAAAWSAGPGGWAGGGALQTTHTTAGWQGWTPTVNFDWGSGHQPDMINLATAGNGRLAFDILVDGSTFALGVSDWYQVSMAANSGGGWTQLDGLVNGWHDQNDNNLYVTHVDKSFAELNWVPGTGWFQLNFAANSGASPVRYYLDNVQVYSVTVPEPASFALAGLSSVALLLARRRR
ncbi:MAG: PEP-CTERM sorting domain-containing protein [Verrucomicrobiota bacterium]